MNKTGIFAFILLAVIFFWTFWLPGPKVAADYHITRGANLISNIYPFTWKEVNVADGLGEYTISTLWSQPLHVFFGVMAFLGLSFELETKILGALIIFIVFFSMKKLLAFLGMPFWAGTAGAFFYLTNTFFLLLFDGGQLSLALAYSIMPLVVLSFLKLHEKSSIRNMVMLALSLVLLSFFDIRLIYLVGVIFFLYFLLQVIFKKNLRDLVRTYIPAFAVALVLMAGAHAYWLLPAAFTKAPGLPVGYGRESQVDFLSFSTLGHSIFLQQPHWYKNTFGKISTPGAEFLLIPFLVFLPVFLKKKDFTLTFWLVLALAGIFLSKGSQEPLTAVYPWLFIHVPGFSIFRDPVKFYFLTALAYSVLLGISLKQIRVFRNIIPFLVIIYLFFLARPVFLGQMTGLFSKPLFQEEFAQMSRILKSDTGFSRVFWIPSKAPLGYFSDTHPPVGADRLSSRRPFAVGAVGTYETFNFLREAPDMGEIFDVAGIGYIAYPYLDYRKADMSPDNIRYFYTFSRQLSNLPWLKEVPDSGVPLFQVKNHQDRFFVTPNLWWVLGPESAGLKLSKNALIYAEEFAGLGLRIDEFPEAKIVLNGKTELDLAVGFLNPDDLIFPAGNLDFAPDQSGWWKTEASDLVWWRSFLQENYGIDNRDFDLAGGWAVGEGKRQFSIFNFQFSKEKILLARVMESSRSGKLKFYQDDQEIGEVSTKINGDANVRWFEAGKLASDKELIIASEGDINVVNALAVLDENKWAVYQDKANKLRGRLANFDEKNPDKGTVKVTYQKINSAKYKVLVRGLDKPAFLVFSQNFDGLWKLDGKASLPVYSLLNGFRIESDGDYTVEFEAQKYVFPGLIISGLTLLILARLLFKQK